MAAQPEPFVSSATVQPADFGLNTRTAAILPLRRLTADGRSAMEEASGDRLGSARGLLLGLCLGAGLWVAIGLLAWLMLR